MAPKKGNTARKKKGKIAWKGENRPKRPRGDLNEIGSNLPQQQQQQEVPPQQQQLPESTRQKKLSVSFDQITSQPHSDMYNVIINFQVLKSMFSKLAYPQCHSEVKIVGNLQEKRGLST